MSGFRRFAQSTSRCAGHPAVFGASVALILLWAACGPVFGFSSDWQLVINTGTTIVTFLMVFLIQNTQNRDTEAIQIKLDELIRAIHEADNAMMDLEQMEERELDALRLRYERMAHGARTELEDRQGRGRREMRGPPASRTDDEDPARQVT